MHAEHKNKLGEVCHGKSALGFRHTLGLQLLSAMKAHLMGLIREGLSLVQVMAHHKVYVKEQPFDVRNLAKK
jgi:hypothetical protein